MLCKHKEKKCDKTAHLYCVLKVARDMGGYNDKFWDDEQQELLQGKWDIEIDTSALKSI